MDAMISEDSESITGGRAIAGTPKSTAKRLSLRLSTAGLQSPLAADANGLDLSATFGLQENDDEVEREHIRQNRVRRSSYFNSARARPVKSALADLTENQRTDHYNFCMKLSTENKITQKNVFGLHLIDYMSYMVKKHSETPNFQMASMTLQASAKIYAIRVDSLHAQTLKVAGGLGLGKDKGKAAGGGEEAGDLMEGIVDEEGNRAPQRPKKNKKLKNYVLESTNTIDIASVPTLNVPHEKYQLLNQAFEEGRINGLLYHLNVKDDTCKILLSETCTYVRPKQPYAPLPCDMPKDIVDSFVPLTEEDIEVSTTLSVFSFHILKWPLDDDNVMVEKTFYKDTLGSSKISLPGNSYCPETSEANDTGCQSADFAEDAGDFEMHMENSAHNHDAIDDCFEPGNGNMSIQQMSSTPMTPAAAQSNRRNSGIFSNSAYLPPTPRPTGLSVKDVTACLSSRPTDYSLFDRKLEAAVLGRNILLGKRAAVNVLQKKPPEGPKPKKPRKIFEFTFDETEEETVKEKLSIATGSTCLSKKALSLWSSDQTTLPQLSYYDEKSLLSLFLKPMPANQILRSCLDLDKSVGEYNYDNDVDREFCPDVMDDDHNDVSGEDHEINLVEMPERVKKDIISFAKVAKFINQKKIKATLWKLLRIPPGQKDSDDLDLPPGMLHPVDFAEAYLSLKRVLSPETSDIITVPIAFVILLHLVNEHNLFLKASQDLKKLLILPAQEKSK